MDPSQSQNLAPNQANPQESNLNQPQTSSNIYETVEFAPSPAKRPRTKAERMADYQARKDEIHAITQVLIKEEIDPNLVPEDVMDNYLLDAEIKEELPDDADYQAEIDDLQVNIDPDDDSMSSSHHSFVDDSSDSDYVLENESIGNDTPVEDFSDNDTANNIHHFNDDTNSTSIKTEPDMSIDEPTISYGSNENTSTSGSLGSDIPKITIDGHLMAPITPIGTFNLSANSINLDDTVYMPQLVFNGHPLPPLRPVKPKDSQFEHVEVKKENDPDLLDQNGVEDDEIWKTNIVHQLNHQFSFTKIYPMNFNNCKIVNLNFTKDKDK